MAYFQNRKTGQVYQVGEDAILGSDMALLGAETFIGAEGESLLAQVAAARQANGYVATAKQAVPAAFYQLLPFSADYVASESRTLQLQPQRTFRADNLVVSSPEGPYFELYLWTVGQENMFVADGSVNCAVFSEGAAQRGLQMRGFTANQGAIINLGFRNTDTTAPHRVSGMISGPAMMKVG